MDKFVQLPFVLPELRPEQQQRFCASLFAQPSVAAEPKDGAVVQRAASELERELAPEDLKSPEGRQRIRAVVRGLHDVDPRRAERLMERCQELSAKTFRDADPEVQELLLGIGEELRGNPRAIKRAAALYRFHHFLAEARRLEGLPTATPEQLARCIVLLVRWPNFVRWIQATSRELALDDDLQVDESPLLGVMMLAKESPSTAAWKRELEAMGLRCSSWCGDPDLKAFLATEARPDSALLAAQGLGLW